MTFLQVQTLNVQSSEYSAELTNTWCVGTPRCSSVFTESPAWTALLGLCLYLHRTLSNHFPLLLFIKANGIASITQHLQCLRYNEWVTWRRLQAHQQTCISPRANTTGHLCEALDQPPWIRRDDSTYVSLNWVTGRKNSCHFTGESTEFYCLSKSSSPRLRSRTGPRLITETVTLLHCLGMDGEQMLPSTEDSWSYSAFHRWQLCADLCRWRVKREGESVQKMTAECGRQVPGDERALLGNLAQAF